PKMACNMFDNGAQDCVCYFADPGFKDVIDLHRVGYPIATIDANGDCVIGKSDHSGGCVNARTVKEQLLYELHDPAAYLTPDVVADISEAEVRESGVDEATLSGGRGHGRPEQVTGNVCF